MARVRGYDTSVNKAIKYDDKSSKKRWWRELKRFLRNGAAGRARK